MRDERCCAGFGGFVEGGTKLEDGLSVVEEDVGVVVESLEDVFRTGEIDYGLGGSQRFDVV